MRTKDGSVLTSYFNYKDAPSGSTVYDQGSQLMLGQVEKVHFVDDALNRSKKYVEYDVSVRDAGGGQSLYKNVRQLTNLGGTNDHAETVLESNEFAFEGKLDSSNIFKNKNGSIVILAFLNKSIEKPFILGCIAHPKRDGATREDGIRNLMEFRGLEVEIDKDGALRVSYNGSRAADGELDRPETSLTNLTIDKDGRFRIEDNEAQSVTLDRVSKKINVTQKEGDEVVTDLEFDKPAEAVTLKFKSGLTIVCDGAGDKVSITTTGGAMALVDGNSGTIELKDNGTGKIKITGDKVAIGASSAELLEQLSSALQEIITFANSEQNHIHTGNLGYPTAPPLTSSNWASFGSAISAIKGLVDGIKGTL
jgi:hypothetical protein